MFTLAYCFKYRLKHTYIYIYAKISIFSLASSFCLIERKLWNLLYAYMCGENGLNSTSVNCFKFREHVETIEPYLCTSMSICTLCGTFGTKSLFKTIARLARTYAVYLVHRTRHSQFHLNRAAERRKRATGLLYSRWIWGAQKEYKAEHLKHRPE